MSSLHSNFSHSFFNATKAENGKKARHQWSARNTTYTSIQSVTNGPDAGYWLTVLGPAGKVPDQLSYPLVW